VLIFEPQISRIFTDFHFSPSRDDEGCTLEAFSIILFCASRLAPSEYLKPSPTIACSSSLRQEPRRSFGAYAKRPCGTTTFYIKRQHDVEMEEPGEACGTTTFYIKRQPLA